MKSRRQFVIDNIAAWFLAPELAQRIEWLAQHKEKPYLRDIKNPDVKIFAQWDYGYYHLTYGEDRDGDILNDLSWGRFCEEYLGINPNDKRSILDWAEDQGLHDPEYGVIYEIPKPEDPADSYAWEQYVEGRWSTCDCPSAEAYHYLSGLDLGPSKPTEDDPLGYLELTQGPHPGSNATYALAHDHSTLSCLQHRLLEIGEETEIIVTS